jgi:hypothetical protein
MPQSIVNALATNLKLQAPLQYYRTLAVLSQTSHKGTIASRFRNETIDGIAVAAPPLAEYIQDLYSNRANIDEVRIDLQIQDKELITKEEVSQSLRHLGNKAAGIDQLKDTHLKRNHENIALIDKMTDFYNSCLRNGHLPAYMTTARVIPLSKNDTAFPPTGEVRTIAITPAVTKVFEKIMNTRLAQQIEEHKLLDTHQRGFRRGTCTAHNIRDVAELLARVSNECQ